MEEPGGSGARITKMKDGTTHLAHKAEHAVDLSSGALLAITLQPASEGDTSTIQKTLEEAQSIVDEIRENGVEEVVADKGYHSGEVLKDLHDEGVRTYIPEPDRGPRHWEGKAVEQQRTYENRRRVRGNRGKRLQKTRSELTERSFAHMYDTGGMRRVHLRGRDNILKRLLVQGAAFNLSLMIRCSFRWSSSNWSLSHLFHAGVPKDPKSWFFGMNTQHLPYRIGPGRARFRSLERYPFHR
jgi:transposase